MATDERLDEAFKRFDLANSRDPNTEEYLGKTYPKEVLYATRMSAKLNEFAPEASEALRLTARCQHICRWEIPRGSYDMDRSGYLRWRQDLKKFHAEKAAGILSEVGYHEDIIDRVRFLLEKKRLKRDPETQLLEDVICLVFLEYYFDAFIEKHPEEKLVDILKKTWNKMSERGRAAALELSHSVRAGQLIKKAVEG